MGDISREPLPGGQRKSGGPGKAPSDLIRFEELGADDAAPPRPGGGNGDPDDPGGARIEDEARARGEAMSSEPHDPHDPHDASPREESADESAMPDAAETERAARFLAQKLSAQRMLDPAIPFEVDPFGEDESTEAGGDPAIESASKPVPETAPEPTSASTIESTELGVEELLTELLTPATADLPSPSLVGGGEPSDDELAADLGVEVTAAPVAATVTAEFDESLDGPAPELQDPGEIARVALAVLLASREPLSLSRLAEVLNSQGKAVQAGLERLSSELRAQGLPLEVVEVDGAYRVSTAPAVYPFLIRLKKLKKAERLTPAALETLAVIAYRQPVIRAEIEAIRGVKAGPVLKSLLDHKLVRAVGRADVPGRPLQYGTTQNFLDRFGLRSLDELPSIQELRTLG